MDPQQRWKHAAISLSYHISRLYCFANTSITLLTTSDMQAYTMRGGKKLDINGTDY